jgi:hypothetical protein
MVRDFEMYFAHCGRAGCLRRENEALSGEPRGCRKPKPEHGLERVRGVSLLIKGLARDQDHTSSGSVGFDGATREIGEPRCVLVGGPHRRHRLERM